MINQTSFVSSESWFTYLAKQKLTIFEDDPSISDASSLTSWVYFFFENKIHNYSCKSIRSKNCAYNLFSGPQSHRFDYSWSWKIY